MRKMNLLQTVNNNSDVTIVMIGAITMFGLASCQLLTNIQKGNQE